MEIVWEQNLGASKLAIFDESRKNESFGNLRGLQWFLFEYSGINITEVGFDLKFSLYITYLYPAFNPIFVSCLT